MSDTTITYEGVEIDLSPQAIKAELATHPKDFATGSCGDGESCLIAGYIDRALVRAGLCDPGQVTIWVDGSSIDIGIDFDPPFPHKRFHTPLSTRGVINAYDELRGAPLAAYVYQYLALRGIW